MKIVNLAKGELGFGQLELTEIPGMYAHENVYEELPQLDVSNSVLNNSMDNTLESNLLRTESQVFVFQI
jgi:hypothetical protein